MGRAHESPQGSDADRRDEPRRVGVASPEQRLEGVVERAGGHPLRLGLVEHAEPGVEAQGDGMRGEQAPAEAVDRRDQRPLAVAAHLRERRGPLLLAPIRCARGARSELGPDPMA